MFGHLVPTCLNAHTCTHAHMYTLKHRLKIFRPCYQSSSVTEKYIYKFTINIINVLNIELFDSRVFFKT